MCVVSIQAHSYLMYGAMDGNRLCAVALGNKHAFGLDGVPLDYDQGYGTLRLCVTSSSLTESLSGGASIYNLGGGAKPECRRHWGRG